MFDTSCLFRSRKIKAVDLINIIIAVIMAVQLFFSNPLQLCECLDHFNFHALLLGGATRHLDGLLCIRRKCFKDIDVFSKQFVTLNNTFKYVVTFFFAVY
jgi:hypothetical protein